MGCRSTCSQEQDISGPERNSRMLDFYWDNRNHRRILTHNLGRGAVDTLSHHLKFLLSKDQIISLKLEHLDDEVMLEITKCAHWHRISCHDIYIEDCGSQSLSGFHMCGKPAHCNKLQKKRLTDGELLGLQGSKLNLQGVGLDAGQNRYTAVTIQGLYAFMNQWIETKRSLRSISLPQMRNISP